MDVWVDGHRLGVTPCTAALTPGQHFLTAVSEGIEPIIGQYPVTEQPGQESVLRVVPITTESYPRIMREVTATLSRHIDNPHLIMIGLILSTDATDRKILLGELDKLVQRDPLAETLRARALLDAGNVDGAYRAAASAVDQWPQYAFAWRTLATVLTQQGQYDAALDIANKAVVLEPNAWRNLRVRAVIYSKMGKDSAARNDKERADEIFHAFQERASKIQ